MTITCYISYQCVLSKSPQPSALTSPTQSTSILLDDTIVTVTATVTATATASSEKPPTALCTKFQVQWDRLCYESKQLKKLHYCLMNKWQIGTQIQPSWILQHGADIEDEDGTCYFVCKTCHLSRTYHKGIYIIGSTSHAKNHL